VDVEERANLDWRASHLASSWSRNDHEDGGPTIQLPAAEKLHPSHVPTHTVYRRNLARVATGEQHLVRAEALSAQRAVPPQLQDASVNV
jgi:hypothetical protein